MTNAPSRAFAAIGTLACAALAVAGMAAVTLRSAHRAEAMAPVAAAPAHMNWREIAFAAETALLPSASARSTR